MFSSPILELRRNFICEILMFFDMLLLAIFHRVLTFLCFTLFGM